jgi:hypothetical protein
METVKISRNQRVIIHRENRRDTKFWQAMQDKKARVVSVHTKAAVVELDDNKELFVIGIKDLRVDNGTD